MNFEDIEDKDGTYNHLMAKKQVSNTLLQASGSPGTCGLLAGSKPPEL